MKTVNADVSMFLDRLAPIAPLLWWMAAASLLSLVVSLLLIPWIILRIPTGYFHRPARRPLRTLSAHPKRQLIVIALKNLAGIGFILAGTAMLILPGQGLLTILIGLMLTNFPGKFHLEQRLIRQRRILQAVNWMRRKADRPPLSIPDRPSGSD